jgi:hypothetical protein
MASLRHRKRIKVGVTVLAAATVALGIGIGTANAGTRPWTAGKHHKPAPTASATATPSASPSAAATTAAPSPSATASATKSASPTAAATVSATATPSATTSAGSWAPPPANATFDYQIGEAYTPPAGVTVVSRDYTASPAAGLYNICYINAFQAQTDAATWWKTNHPDLLLHDASGNLVIDKDWNEILLDYSTAAKRAALTTIVGGWIDQCASKGFKGLEPDNLDAYTRSNGLLTESEAVAYAGSLISYAHGKGLAVGQKNTADLSTASAKQAGFDFAVAEQCADYSECGNYTATYGGHVIVIEYSQSQFTKACNTYGSTLSIVLRDVDVTAPGSDSYVFKTC